MGRQSTLTDVVLETRSLESLDDLEEKKAWISKRFLDLGYDFFSYHLVEVQGLGPILNTAVTNYPDEWVIRYIEQEYVLNDPMLEMGRQSAAPFLWSDTVDLKKLAPQARSFLNEAGDFNLNSASGASVPFNSNRLHAMMSFVPDGDEKHALDVHKASFFEACALSISCHHLLANELYEKVRQSQKPVLTPREQEVLKWASLGKTNWEISEILSISQRTVDSHFENVSAKLDTVNRTHSVVTAIMKKLIEV